jgi:predicted O-methyltransferase YrrM
MSTYPALNFLTPQRHHDWLAIVNEIASDKEIRAADAIRKQFLRENNRSPYMVDFVRAFRVLKNAKSYIEVGTRDKGNVAYVAELMDPCATIIDADLENDSSAEARVRKKIAESQAYVAIEGNSISDHVIDQVSQHVPLGTVDAVFLDSNHMYFHFLNEIDRYMPFVRPGGWVIAHDVLWEGTSEQKGKAQACELVDRHFPVYLVNGNRPVTRFMRHQKNNAVWGCVGIFQKPHSSNNVGEFE